MTQQTSDSADLSRLVESRLELERRLKNEPGDLADSRGDSYANEYSVLQRQLARIFREERDEQVRIETMLEIVRILENRLVYLQNFSIDPTADNRILASLVSSFLDQIAGNASATLSPLEVTYFRGIAALYAAQPGVAATFFEQACESEESDETNDIKFKSFVILGNLSYEREDFQGARELHEKSLRYSSNNNVTAQALALKALNSYALGERDEALDLFGRALSLFDRDQPFFNSYFYRNALLFCGLIHYERRGYEEAEKFYRQVLEEVDQHSYDYFDALGQLGRISYSTGRYDEAVRALSAAIAMHRFNENEYLVDAWYWLAKSYVRAHRLGEAKTLLEKIATTEVRYEKKEQAAELLRRVS